MFFCLFIFKIYKNRNINNQVTHKPNEYLINQVEKKVIVSLKPDIEYSYDYMKEGVIQHLDRNYTYDYIPKEIKNIVLFQGVHRPVNETSIKFELFESAMVYFFFHETVDGGYSEIFKKLNGWLECYDTPKYDIYNGSHGLKMKMYKKHHEKGVYQIPETTKARACFSIGFKFKNKLNE